MTIIVRLFPVLCTEKNQEKMSRKRLKIFPNFLKMRIFLSKLANISHCLFSHDFLTLFVSVLTC